jgi:ATP-dependent HslUV protease ATP-binding subunit HslU
LETDGVHVDFAPDAIDEMARIAFDLNRTQQNIGARRLYTILERVLEKISFDAPDAVSGSIKIDAAYVKQRLADLLKDEDLSQFIL